MPQILFIHSSAFASEIRKENQGSYTRKMARILRETVRGRGVKIVERQTSRRTPHARSNRAPQGKRGTRQ